MRFGPQALTAEFFLLTFRRYPSHASISFSVLLTSFPFAQGWLRI